MKKDTLLRLVPERVGEALCKSGTHIYSIKYDTKMPVYNTLEIKKDFLVNITWIDIYRTRYETYIVQVWESKKDKNTFHQYATLKEAWTFKRGKMRTKKYKNEYNTINVEWNYDNFLQEVLR